MLDGTRRRSRISSIRACREGSLDRALSVPACSFVFELTGCDQSALECLLNSDRGLLRLELVDNVDERTCRSSERKPISPDDADRRVVGARMDHHSGGSSKPAMPSGNEQVHRAGNVVAQIEQGERAPMRENGLLGSNGQTMRRARSSPKMVITEQAPRRHRLRTSST